MEVNRYDRSAIRATKTDEGYLTDTPVVGRVGIQTYMNADGSIRRELRPPEEVFNADSLASFAGKPITDEHPSVEVNAANAKKLSVGVMQGKAVQDGDNVTVPIIIHDATVIDKIIKGGKRELSLGYKVDLEETPGVWNGLEYDAIQRNIRINHLAIVPRGRAGNARLNLDRHDAVSVNNEEISMSADNLGRIRLDSGLEYQAAPEVVVAFEQLKSDAADHQCRVDALNAEIDKLAAERDSLKSEVAKIEQIRADAKAEAMAEIKARASLEAIAAEFKVDCNGLADRDVKIAVIKTVRADADLGGKSDVYVDAAFDLAVEMKSTEAIKKQREAGSGRDDAKPQTASYKNFMQNLGKKES